MIVSRQVEAYSRQMVDRCVEVGSSSCMNSVDHNCDSWS